MFTKIGVVLIVVESAIAAGIVAAGEYFDGAAERIALYVTALTLAGGAIRWIWRNLLKPLAQLIKRTLESVEAFESLPEWKGEIDERLSSVEGEMGKHQHGMKVVLGQQRAIMRDLGIEARGWEKQDPFADDGAGTSRAA